MKVTIANTKGGVAKTTTTILMATAIADTGAGVEVWDADPQGSATGWADIATDGGDPLPFPVIAVNARSVRKAPGASVDDVLIDTNPHTPDIVQAAIDTSDLVIIPTTASPLDLERTWMTIDVCRGTGIRFAVLITIAEPRTIAHRQTVAALTDNHVPLLTTTIAKTTHIKDEATRRPHHLYGYDDAARELGLI